MNPSRTSPGTQRSTHQESRCFHFRETSKRQTAVCVDVFVDVFYRISRRSDNECPSCRTTNYTRTKSNIYRNNYRWTVVICLPTGILDTYKPLCHVLQHKHNLNIHWGINCLYYKYIINCQYYKYTIHCQFYKYTLNCQYYKYTGN